MLDQKLFFLYISLRYYKFQIIQREESQERQGKCDIQVCKISAKLPTQDSLSINLKLHGKNTEFFSPCHSVVNI